MFPMIKQTFNETEMSGKITTRAHFTVGVTDKTSAKSSFIAPTPKCKRFTYTETQIDMDGR